MDISLSPSQTANGLSSFFLDRSSKTTSYDIEDLITAVLGAFADNLELFPYFVPQDGKGQTERKGQVRKVLEAVQDIFDLDHLAVYENKMLTALDLRDKGILYAYIKESLWDVLVKSQDQCLERLVNLQYSDLTGSGPNPNVSFRLVMGKITDNTLVIGLAGASYDQKSFFNGLSAYRKDAASLLQPTSTLISTYNIKNISSLVVDKRAFGLSKENWNQKPETALFAANVASWFGLMSTAVGVQPSTALAVSKELSVQIKNRENDTTIEVKQKNTSFF